MEYIEIPETRKIRGEDAIQALKEYVKELEEKREGKELSAKHARAMIKLANGLISSIDAEVRAEQTRKKAGSGRFIDRLKQTVMRSIAELGLTYDEP